MVLTSRWPDRLLDWFARQRRQMPWRDDPSPYNVWISEVMLQQTRVSVAVPYFNRFIAAFPNVYALAKARLEDVLVIWEGLGYYSRARHIHAAASQIVGKYNGALPQSFRDWIELPGIGTYTAAAIASIAYGEKVPAVDGNVLRVMSRFLGQKYVVSNTASIRKVIAVLRPVIEAVNPSLFNQALMETGAMICLPRNPRCRHCALAPECFAFRTDQVHEFPLKKSGKVAPHHFEIAAVIRKRGNVLISKTYRDNMLRGLSEFPRLEVKNPYNIKNDFSLLVLKETGLSVGSAAPLLTIRHAYSHFAVTVHVFECQWIKGVLKSGLRGRFRWIGAQMFDKIPMSRVSRRICASLKENA